MAQKDDAIISKNSMKAVSNVLFFIGILVYSFYTMMMGHHDKTVIDKSSGDIYISSQLCYGLMLFFFMLSAPQVIITLTGLTFLSPFHKKDIEPKFWSKDFASTNSSTGY